MMPIINVMSLAKLIAIVPGRYANWASIPVGEQGIAMASPKAGARRNHTRR